MDTGSEGENINDNNDCQSDGPKKPKRLMKTPSQLKILEETYALETRPSDATRAQLSDSLGLTDRQLRMWFCYRRLKDKKEETIKRAVGEPMEHLESSKQELIVAGHNGVGGSDHGSGSGSGSDNEPLVHSRAYKFTQQRMMVRRIIESVEARLGESLREDGPVLGIEFDELSPDAFETPPVVKKPHSQATKYKKGQLPPSCVAPGQLKGGSLSMQKGEVGHLSSPISDNGFIEPNEEVTQISRKRKSEDVGRDGQSEKRMKKELDRIDLLRKKKEEQTKKEMEKQDRERHKEKERMMRERQRQEERFQREERREIERREKFLQKESLKAERRRQKEELQREKEAIKVKAAIEKEAARKIAKESTELIEDERLELLELAASHKGLASIVSLDYETLQNLDTFRDLLCEFPPKSVQKRL